MEIIYETQKIWKYQWKKKIAFNKLTVEKVQLKAEEIFKILKKWHLWKRRKEMIVKLPTIDLKNIAENVFKLPEFFFS